MIDRPLPRPAVPDSTLRAIKVYMSPEMWADVTRRAALAGMSASAYLKTLAERDTVDEAGRPTWAPAQEAQLPIAS